MFQHVYPEQPAGGLHTRVVWVEARQLPLLRVKLIYPHFLLWKLVSLKTSFVEIENSSQKQKEVANQPKNRGGLFILNVPTTFLLRFVRIIRWGEVWPRGSDDREVWQSHCQCVELPSILGVISRCLHISCRGVRWLHLIMKFVGSRSPMRKASCFEQCPLFP